MTGQHPIIDAPAGVLRQIDLVAMHPDQAVEHQEILAATLKSISRVLGDFLAAQGLPQDRIAIIDGFFFLFNEPEFSRWYSLNWWEQRSCIQEIKDNPVYTGRAQALLARSCLAPYMDYSDEMVARSTELEVKRAWMRKRLILKECYWNAIDTISHAAFYHKKYHDLYPALCLLLCKVIDKNGRESELVFGIDNGTGFLYKKKSRESALIRFLYKIFKFFFRGGVFYIGGLELGLLETESKLSCHGSGAVVYQGW